MQEVYCCEVLRLRATVQRCQNTSQWSTILSQAMWFIMKYIGCWPVSSKLLNLDLLKPNVCILNLTLCRRCPFGSMTTPEVNILIFSPHWKYGNVWESFSCLECLAFLNLKCCFITFQWVWAQVRKKSFQSHSFTFAGLHIVLTKLWDPFGLIILLQCGSFYIKV